LGTKNKGIGGQYLKNEIISWRISHQLMAIENVEIRFNHFLDHLVESSLQHYATLSLRGGWPRDKYPLVSQFRKYLRGVLTYYISSSSFNPDNYS
jgi:hypothetical protein